MFVFFRCRKYQKSWWNGAAELHISEDLLCGTTAAELLHNSVDYFVWHNCRRATQLGRFTLWNNGPRATQLSRFTLWHNGRRAEQPGFIDACTMSHTHFPTQIRGCVLVPRTQLCHLTRKKTLLRVTRGARNPNLQVFITHTSHVCSQHSLHSFGLPLRKYGVHRTQFDHARFWPSVTWNLPKAQRWSKSVLTFDCCRPHSLTFGHY